MGSLKHILHQYTYKFVQLDIYKLKLILIIKEINEITLQINKIMEILSFWMVH